MIKRGVFFSIDALLSFTIILIVALLAFPLVKINQYDSSLAADVLDTLSSLKVGGSTNSYINSLIAQGKLDANKTILEQIGILTITNESLAKEIAQIMLADLETNENIGIWYGDKLIYSQNKTAYENATNILTERYVVSGLGGLNGTGILAGYSARAFLSSTYQTTYAYLGGYVGDGNITQRIEYQGNISLAELEIVVNKNFTLYINGVYSGNYSASLSETEPVKYSLNGYLSNFVSGANTLEFRGNNLYIAGGYIKIAYLADASANQEKKKYLPGINGIVNLYDGVSINGQLNSIDIFLHYKIPYQSFMKIGNVTVWNGSSSTETTTSISNSQLTSLLSYNQLSNTTVPLRFGSENFSFTSNNSNGNADIILITDVSGSMSWRMNVDGVSGVDRTCVDPLLYSDPTTRRLSVAKCLDYDFVKTILGGNGNRVGLTTISDSSNSYLNLTSNITLLNSTIYGYGTVGSTCISCAINRAYLMLQQNSNSSRQKYVILMTDGVATQRSTAQCYNLKDLAQTNLTSIRVFGVGDAGLITTSTNSQWSQISSPTASNIRGADLLNTTYGFAVGDSYQLFGWNGISWTLSQDLGSQNLYGVNIFNRTLAFAVGDDGKIARFNGTGWSEYQDTGSDNFKDVIIANGTFGFAVGNSGKIFRWLGNTWSEYQDTGSDNFVGIDMLNRTHGFAVADSGRMFFWNGITWSSQQTISANITNIDIYNSTLSFATGSSGQIYRKVGTGAWASNYGAFQFLNSIKIINNSFGIASGHSDNGITVWNGITWNKTYPQYYYAGNSSTGLSCGDISWDCNLPETVPSLNANYSSCRVNKEQNATVHSIGFGPTSTCTLSSRTLLSVASCGNGSYYASANATQLQQIYANISQNIIQLSYSEQTASSSSGANGTGILYSDSYIKLNYTTPANPFGLLISLEKQFYNTTTGNFSIYPNSTIIDAQAMSYSSKRWTDKLKLNGNTIYNLTRYGSSYTILGDPYSILIPRSSVLNQNEVVVTTAVSLTNVTVGSASNKIIYTLAKNFSSFSPILAVAQGCIWNMQFEDNSNLTAKIPSTYSGSNQCYYLPSGGFTHDPNDAFQVAAYNIIRQLDLDGNLKIDPKITSQALQIDISQVNGIPYTWYTEVQMRTWT